MKTLRVLWATTRFLLFHPLNAQHRITALWKFIRWQISARLMRQPMIFPWVDDSRFITHLGETGLTGNLYAGFMEYHDMLFLLHALRAEDRFVDIGANVGAYTILASRVVGARSIAFEPIPATAERLKDQVRINGIEPLVDIHQKGVGRTSGQLDFTNDHDTINHVSVTGPAINTTRVEVTTLDHELCEEASYFLKIDVEGFEHEVIHGGARALSSNRVRAIIIELNGATLAYGHRIEEIHETLLSMGFIPMAYEPRARVVSALPSFHASASNTIYVKDLEWIAERCRTAPRRVVHTAHGLEL